MPSSKGSSKSSKKKSNSMRQNKLEFPAKSLRDLLNPFGDTRRARHERQKVFRLLVRNRPRVVRKNNALTQEAVVAIPRPVPAVADVDEYLEELYELVYRSDSKTNPKLGEENDRGKVMPARDGGRLNTLSIKELQKIIVNLNKNRKRIVVSTGLAATEKTQIFNQLTTLELQMKTKRQTCEMFERAKQDLARSITHTDRVYKEKLKATQSEYYQTLFEGKTAHLTYYLGQEQQYWREEKNQHEELAASAERAQYDKLLLERIGKEVNLDEFRRRQISKEDYLMVLQSQLENFEVFIADTQAEVDSQVKTHARYLDKLKQHNFDGMMMSQDKTISELRKFFQGVNTSNSNIIHQLKSDVNRKRLRLDRLERDVFIALEENAKILIPLNHVNREVIKYEKLVEGAEKVRAEHQRLWIKAKKLEDHVLRLNWRRELAVDRVNKSKAQLDHLQNVYTQTTMEIARKAGLAELVHSKTHALLEEERAIYRLSHLIMEAFAGVEYKSKLHRDVQIQRFLEEQEEEIYQLRLQGMLLKRKYDRNREKILTLFQTKFLRSLQSTGFQIPTLEAHLANGLIFFQGIPEKHLLDIEKHPDLAELNHLNVLRVKDT
ncbi:hypothetical protein BV898_11753 [Hypsibius exemplaris]|uniref:Dynein regulatory complex subunit 4 n=1 Tax=Hypsibius exemplaris TaxID=2072580 RepID=A0A1W0WFV6_HYPEX|nr:hypothetical protein BV898_11753 [Hypsibius exemplaris]